MFKWLRSERRLQVVEDGLIALDRRCRAQDIALEALEVRVQKLHARLAQEKRWLHNHEEPTQEDGSAAETNSGSPLTPNWNLLTPRQKTIQMQVMGRRRVNGGAR